ncbi:MAG TPA: hypothetical protein VFT16_05590 [Candidatus Saccharimonadales bacterium]|nr:hypothetical protein [Candidatus Saccharimonadales bacterium]
MAETKIKLLAPGIYDEETDAAYNSKEGQKRLYNENQGLMHIRAGNYVMTEFQLHED